MRRFALLVAGLALLAGVAATAPGGSGAAQSQGTCTPRWRISPTPRLAGESSLLGVTAVSSGDVWAVGVRSGDTTELSPILVERWNGRRWTVVGTPRIDNGVLTSVAAVSARDVWAVGARGKRPLAMHWDGRAWNIIPTPDIGPGALYGVAALAHNDVWAVGTHQAFHYVGNGPREALIMHWNGRRWSGVADADPSRKEKVVLLGIAASGPDDVWAVGQNWKQPRRRVEHWDGRRWTFVAAPGDGYLYGVGALANGQAWAVGWDLVQWTRTKWMRMPGSIPGGRSGVAAISDNDIWVVGGKDRGTHDIYYDRVKAHWNGRAWKVVVNRPSSDSPSSALAAVTAVSSTDVWAVGYLAEPGGFETPEHALIEHYSCVP